MRKVVLALVTVLCAMTAHCSEHDALAPLPRCEPNATCDTPLASAGLRRLSAREYRNAVRDLLGVETAPSVDADRGRFDNGPRDVWITAELVEDYEQLAWQVAAGATADTARRGALVGSCTHDCVEAFLETFVPRAFRRAPTEPEKARLRALWQSAGPGERESLEAACAATLNSPAFLYREEIGATTPRGTAALTDDELASALSFFVLGSIPDAELLRAARAHELTQGDGLEAQARRLLASPASAAHFETFLDQWFATNDLDIRTKDRDAYPGFDEPFRASLQRDVRAFYKQSLREGASIRSLFSSPVSLSAESKVRYPDGRLGILEHPAFLATHGGYDTSGPISRGVFALNALLCAPPAPPPAGIPRRPPEPSTAITTRQRYEAHVSQPVCQACHTSIDGIGFGFEGFDGAGRARSVEAGRPIDASGLLFVPGRVSMSFHGVRELAEHAVTLPDVAVCYSMQLTRFSLGTGERARDTKVAQALSGDATTDTSITDLVLHITRTRAFRERLAKGGAQ